jgi:hypothetical protein
VLVALARGRSRSSEEREQAFEQFCADLRVAKRLLDRAIAPGSGAARAARRSAQRSV